MGSLVQSVFFAILSDYVPSQLPSIFCTAKKTLFIVIKIRKRAHTPILLGLKKLTEGVKVPWLDGKKVRIQWTA